MQWYDIIEQKCGIKITDRKRFFSRRNQVYLIRTDKREHGSDTYIAKIHQESRGDREAYTLMSLINSGIEVPRVIWHNKQIILMEYIKGIVLADLLVENKQPVGGEKQWTGGLARWLFQLHSFLTVDDKVSCKPDLNLRNFIYSNEKFYGIDFEECILDRRERDLGGICAFILNNDPMFADWKYLLVKELVREYSCLYQAPLDIELMRNYFLEELKNAAARRSNQRVFLQQKIWEFQEEWVDIWE